MEKLDYSLRETLRLVSLLKEAKDDLDALKERSWFYIKALEFRDIRETKEVQNDCTCKSETVNASPFLDSLDPLEVIKTLEEIEEFLDNILETSIFDFNPYLFSEPFAKVLSLRDKIVDSLSLRMDTSFLSKEHFYSKVFEILTKLLVSLEALLDSSKVNTLSILDFETVLDNVSEQDLDFEIENLLDKMLVEERLYPSTAKGLFHVNLLKLLRLASLRFNLSGSKLKQRLKIEI